MGSDALSDVLVVVLPPVVLWALARADQVIRAHLRERERAAVMASLDHAACTAVRATQQSFVDDCARDGSGMLDDGVAATARNVAYDAALQILGANQRLRAERHLGQASTAAAMRHLIEAHVGRNKIGKPPE